MNRGSMQYQSYVKNLNRVYMVDFIDRLTQETVRRPARASLVDYDFEMTVPAGNSHR